jgi:hypothetical protein
MKKIILVFLIFQSFWSIMAQQKFMYQCKDVIQKDSIAFDLKMKGYAEYVCDAKGIYLKLHDDHTFCFTSGLMGYNELSLKEIYSKVEVNAKAINNEAEDKCPEIEIKTDKFNGEVSYNSPFIDNISFTKYKRKGIISQYVSISVYDTYLAGYNNTGLTILFKSGKKIVRSKEKVDVNNSSGADWSYSVFFTPTPNEINLLKKEEIDAVKLFIFDAEISDGNKVREYANCMLVTPKAKKK